jgi:hypothetical protein
MPVRCRILAYCSRFAVLSALVVSSVASSVPENRVWTRPEIVPLPDSVAGIRNPVISLDGTWKINLSPGMGFWENDVDSSSWRDVVVPGQADMQGLQIPRDHQYAYKSRISIPSEFANKRIFLRFEGVTGTAMAWVNGALVGEHYGGFTVWNCDITDKVSAGKLADLTVGVTEPQPHASTEGYSGGIIRNVKLIALPKEYLSRFNVETDFDRDYRNAKLKVWVKLADIESPGEVRLILKDPAGQVVPLKSGQIALTVDNAEVISELPIFSPAKWSAEHPNLYTLEACVVFRGQIVESVSRKIGFRKVEASGRKLLVNGREIKLRGVGQFDSDALYGTTLLPGEAENDVRLYKEANLNFVRPATYPATQEFLDACDRYGLYVEGEAPVTFTRGTESDPKLAHIFLNQTSEMVEADRSHPSIILWDLSNESNYGINIRQESEYIHEEDPSRPVVFSWSHEVPPNEPLPYDVYSYHYPATTDDMGTPGVAVFNSAATRVVPPTMPVLADEFAHAPCYDFDELKRDPNIHNFWGESIKLFWEKMFTTDGSTGGAIWAGIDDPITRTRTYGWGLLDVWRRPKPEYWLAKKAFSPIRIDDQPIHNPVSGRPLEIPIENWYDDSNLNEVKIFWRVGNESGSLRGPDVAPHAKGVLRLPDRLWRQDETLNLMFLAASGSLVDEYNLAVDPVAPVFPGPQGPPPRIEESPDLIVLTGPTFVLTFSKRTGLLIRGTYKGSDLLSGGPYLNILGADLEAWSLSTLRVTTRGQEAVLELQGTYGPVQVKFEVRVDGQGLITTEYVVEKFPLTTPRKHEIPWNVTNAGGFEEVGVSYDLSKSVDTLSWFRTGLWSAYPDDHIGRVRGTAQRQGKGANAQPGVRPQWSWAEDEKDFNLFGSEDTGGRGSNDFRSAKENIFYASAIESDTGVRVRVESAGTDALRLEVLGADPHGTVRLFVSNAWNYRNLGLGNYMKPPVTVTSGYRNSVKMRLTDGDGMN